MSLFSSDDIGDKNYKRGSVVDAFLNDSFSISDDSPFKDFPEYLGEEDTSLKESFFSRRTPAKNKYKNIPFSSTFFRSIGGLFNILSNPLGFFWKFISIVIQPFFFGFGAYFFFNFYMEQSRYFSLAVASVFYIETLRESFVCISPRPKFKELLELFAHQIATLWIMWTFSSATYSVMRADNNEINQTLYIALAVATVIWFLASPYVAYRIGSSKLIKYFYQITAVVLSTGIVTFIGYFLSSYIWEYFFSSEPIFLRRYAVAIVFGFFGFWGAVNQFYIPDATYLRNEERGEERLTI